MKNNINEINSSQFRNTIKSLGFSEKGSELTSGGEINSALLDIMDALVKEWKKIGGSNCPLKFTSGNDKYHKTVGYTSLHSKGQAMDVTLPSGCHTSFIKLLNTYKSKYKGFSFIDEYRNPSKKATGGHFHMSYNSGQPESSTVNTGVSSNSEIDTSDGDSLLKNVLLKNLGLNDLTKGFAGIQEDIIRIKKLMK